MPMKITYHKLDSNFLDSVCELDSICFDVNWSRSVFENEISNPKSYYIVAVCDGKAVGYCGIDFVVMYVSHLLYKKYMNDIFDVVDNLENTYISYRIWINNKYNEEIINILNNHYNTNIKEKKKIKNNIFFSEFHEFIWPDLDNNYYNDKGKCYALKDHIGILSNGNIVPCCLDTKGIITLGNIYNDDLKKILNSTRVNRMINNFKNNKKCEELCKHCNFIQN